MLKKTKLPLTNAPEYKVVPLEPVLSDDKPENQRHFPTTTKTLALGIITIVLIGGGAGGWWLSQNARSSLTKPEVNQDSNVVSLLAKLLIWDDPAGFTFKYPDELSVDKHEEDQENYANVELTNQNHPGKIVVLVKDLPVGNKKTPVTTVDDWVTSDKILSAGNIVDTTLGDKTAKKILLGGQDEKIVTGVVYDDVLWLVEGQLIDKTYWSTVYKSITENFEFKPLADQTTDTANSNVEVAVDEEEVVE